MLLPGDESRPMKATMASTTLSWKLTFPPASKSGRDKGGASNKTVSAPVTVAEAAQVELEVDESADRKSTRLNSSHPSRSRMPSSA